MVIGWHMRETYNSNTIVFVLNWQVNFVRVQLKIPPWYKNQLCSRGTFDNIVMQHGHSVDSLLCCKLVHSVVVLERYKEKKQFM